MELAQSKKTDRRHAKSRLLQPKKDPSISKTSPMSTTPKLALRGDGLSPLAQLVIAKREHIYIEIHMKTPQHKKDPNIWKISPSSKRMWIDLVQKISTCNRGTPTLKRGTYELEYAMRGMHTEDYTYQKWFALRYIRKNYKRRRAHPEESIHKGYCSTLGGEYGPIRAHTT